MLFCAICILSFMNENTDIVPGCTKAKLFAKLRCAPKNHITIKAIK